MYNQRITGQNGKVKKYIIQLTGFTTTTTTTIPNSVNDGICRRVIPLFEDKEIASGTNPKLFILTGWFIQEQEIKKIDCCKFEFNCLRCMTISKTLTKPIYWKLNLSSEISLVLGREFSWYTLKIHSVSISSCR